MMSPAPESDESSQADEPLKWEAVSAFVQWDQTLPAGTRLREYQIRGVIAESDYGIVYLAWDPSLQRRVAIKEYLPRRLAARTQDSIVVECAGVGAMPVFDAGLKAFVAEARVLARFSHTALIKVYRFWEDNGTAYMVMPHHEGPTLERWLAQAARPQSEAEVRTWLRPVLDAVGAMHAARCFHHAIAPDNILLTPVGPVLLGFSAARRLIASMGEGAQAALSPGYAALEQYGEAPPDTFGPATDLQALAAVAWRALVGHAPLPAPERAKAAPPAALAELVAGRCSNRFAETLEAALAARLEARPQDDAAFRERLGGMEPLAAARTGSIGFDLMAEPFTPEDGMREVTVPIPTQPLPLRELEATDPMARPFAASAPIPVDAPVLRAAAAPPATTTTTTTAAEPRLSRHVVIGILAGVVALGTVAATVLYHYAVPTSAASMEPSPATATAGATPPATVEIPSANALPVSAPAVAETTLLQTAAAEPRSAPPDKRMAAAEPATSPGLDVARRIPIDRSPGSEPQRRALCGDLLQEATLRRLSAAEAAFFKKECR